MKETTFEIILSENWKTNIFDRQYKILTKPIKTKLGWEYKVKEL